MGSNGNLMGNIHGTFFFCNVKSKKLNWKLKSTPSRIIDLQLLVQHSCLFDSRLGPFENLYGFEFSAM
jgi:hypothetical protein